MDRSSRYAASLLAAVALAQSASALTFGSWISRELGPASGNEYYQTLAYELGPPSAPDSPDYPGFGRDLHYFLVVGPTYGPTLSWPNAAVPAGTVAHNTGDAAYDQDRWELWGGTCFVGLDAALVAPRFPVPVCVGSDGNVWGFWGANGQFQISINDPQVKVRPAIASRGDGSFDAFYVHSSTSELWHTGWSPARGWIDEVVVVREMPIHAHPLVGGIDAAWAGFGVTAQWANKIVVSYIDPNGQPAALAGTFASSGHEASNNINWTSNGVLSSDHPTRFASIAFVGTSTGTKPTLFYDRGPDACVYQQANTIGALFRSFTIWTAPADLGTRCGDVAARAAPNGPLGSKVNLWEPNNRQLWGFSQ